MEELKVIVDLISQLGEQGKEAFIWWVVMDKGSGLVCLFVWIGFLVYLTSLINKFVSSQNKLMELRDLMEVGSGCWVDYEFYRMKRWVESRK